MENPVDFHLNFLLKKIQTAKFEIVYNSLSPTLKHFIIKDDKGTKGFGTDHNYKLAIDKAYSEFLERKSLHELQNIFGNFTSSNGFAVHVNQKKANESSIFEVLERDNFLCSWHSKTAPYWITKSELDKVLLDHNKVILENHRKKKLTLKLGIVSKTSNIFTCIALVTGRGPHGIFFYIDTKAGENLIDIFNALTESISFFSHFILNGHFNHTKKDYAKLIDPIDHFYYHIMRDMKSDWFNKGSNNVLELSLPEIKTYKIELNVLLEIKNLQRYAAFSESDILQPYYCGKPLRKNVNFRRLESIFGKNYKINSEVHPLS